MTEQMASRPPAPGPVRVVQVVLWVQAVLNLLASGLAAYDVKERFDHNQDVLPVVYPIIGLGLLAGLALLACAISLPLGKSWVRPLAVLIEILVILVGLANLVLVSPLSLVGICLAIAVWATLFSPRVTEWLETINPPWQR
jgi:hypothetical protein